MAGIDIPNAGRYTIKGANGYYYVRAEYMKRFFQQHINVKGVSVGSNHQIIDYGIVYQGGMSNVSGHVDVVFAYMAAGTFYNNSLRGSLYKAKNTIVWKK